jgi:hypothetical protein
MSAMSRLYRPRPIACRSRASQIARALQEPPIETSRPFQSDSVHLDSWKPDSWRDLEALQQPKYPDSNALENSVATIRAMPPLVFAGECRLLQHRLAQAARGEAFVLFGTHKRKYYSIWSICQQALKGIWCAGLACKSFRNLLTHRPYRFLCENCEMPTRRRPRVTLLGC